MHQYGLIKKKSHYVVHGPGHLFIVVQTIRYFVEDLLKIIDTVIQRNTFFGYLENMLLAMAVDERLHIRKLECRRIIKSKNQTTNEISVRAF